MILSWLRRRRRARLLATPFPAEWLRYLEDNLGPYRYLTVAEQAKLRDDVRVFVAEKNWEGCGGLTLTDEMKVTVAAHACLMTLALAGDPLVGVLSILIYPAGYEVREERWRESFSIVGPSARLGEAQYRGPVVLSWAEVARDAQQPGRGHNLVWHEFAHQLDMLDRSTNGTPPLETRAQRRRWYEVMSAEFDQLAADAEEGRATLLDTYGASNEAEFFAVASECFFDRPAELRATHPKLYALLAEYYRQDPAARMAG
jgi:Mlc titration factor MtfA (ptsG expression regulator)